MGKLIQARESLVVDIPAGDGNTAETFFTVWVISIPTFKSSFTVHSSTHVMYIAVHISWG